MGRIITKTFEEIDREWPPEKIKAVLDAAPVFHDDITDEDIATGRVRFVGRGFSVIEEILKGNVPPKSEVKTVTVRLPEAEVAK